MRHKICPFLYEQGIRHECGCLYDNCLERDGADGATDEWLNAPWVVLFLVFFLAAMASVIARH